MTCTRCGKFFPNTTRDDPVPYVCTRCWFGQFVQDNQALPEFRVLAKNGKDPADEAFPEGWRDPADFDPIREDD